jgi:hypothetical protein
MLKNGLSGILMLILCHTYTVASDIDWKFNPFSAGTPLINQEKTTLQPSPQPMLKPPRKRSTPHRPPYAMELLSIWSENGQKQAMINGHIVSEGDILKEHVVAIIRTDNVVLVQKQTGKRFNLRL